MAKDTEKLIRQLSLISYLMAERRPVTALEIRRDVEGYSGMNEDAFARRFYADRSELESLGIQLTVDRPPDAVAEQENYSLRPEEFHLPAIAFTDGELAALGTALSLLDGEFAYAEPLRLALQQLSWGRPSPLSQPEQQPVALGITASRRRPGAVAAPREGRDRDLPRQDDPLRLLHDGARRDRAPARSTRTTCSSRAGSSTSWAAPTTATRCASSACRACAARSRTRRRPSTTSAARRARSSTRASTPAARRGSSARRRGPPRCSCPSASRGRSPATSAASARSVPATTARSSSRRRTPAPAWSRRGCCASASTSRSSARPSSRTRSPSASRRSPRATPTAASSSPGPPTRASCPTPTRTRTPRAAAARATPRSARSASRASSRSRPSSSRPAARGELLDAAELQERLQISDRELREDIDVLNVVSFGGGTYVLYAEVTEDGHVEVDPEPYADNFARPARLLPVEAKALVAAIDLIGEHLPEGALTSAREKIVAALGEDPTERGLQVASTGGDDSAIARVVSEAIAAGRTLRLDYYKPNEDEFVQRTIEPYALMNGREGWYVASFDPARDDVRHFRLDRIRNAEMTDERFTRRPEVDPAADVDGWPRTGEVTASRIARVWVSPERARWAREERRVNEELADGSVIVELPFKGVDWLVREVLAEAGDAVVLEPVDARGAVLGAVERLRAAATAR